MCVMPDILTCLSRYPACQNINGAEETKSLADFKYGVNTDVNIGVSVSRGGNTLFEVMGIC